MMYLYGYIHMGQRRTCPDGCLFKQRLSRELVSTKEQKRFDSPVRSGWSNRRQFDVEAEV